MGIKESSLKLICPVCLEPFSSLKKPYMLSCGHNVCKEDCFKLEGKKCPCCRKICKYGAYNRELINLLEEGN